MKRYRNYLTANLQYLGIMVVGISCVDSIDNDHLIDVENPKVDSLQPNIVLIITDQQSYNMISALADKMPGKVYSNTPNIDRLVNIGTSFTNAYCSNSVSVPSRFSLFTGMYGGQFQIRENKCENIDESVIRKFQSKNALGVLFAQNGYDTYYGGKVHLPLASLEGTSKFKAPTAYGFENYYTKNEREGLGLASAELLTDLASKQANSDIWKPFLMVASFLNPHDICLESSTNLDRKSVV